MSRIIVADILVIVGLLFMTLGVIGLVRMPDVYTKMHAAAKAVFLGVFALAVSAGLAGAGDATMRAVLLGVIVMLTTPVSAHAIARAAYAHGDRMLTPGALDETGHHLADYERAEVTWKRPRRRARKERPRS